MIALLLFVTVCGEQHKDTVPPEWDLFGALSTWEEVPIMWQFSCTFPGKFRASAKEGFDYWESIIGYDLFVEDKECWDGTDLPKPLRVVVNYSLTEARMNKDHPVLAWAYGGTEGGYIVRGEIRFIAAWFGRKDHQRKTLSRHEVGHILGMSHVLVTKCLMFPTMNSSDGLKKACEREKMEFLERYERD